MAIETDPQPTEPEPEPSGVRIGYAIAFVMSLALAASFLLFTCWPRGYDYLRNLFRVFVND